MQISSSPLLDKHLSRESETDSLFSPREYNEFARLQLMIEDALLEKIKKEGHLYFVGIESKEFLTYRYDSCKKFFRLFEVE